MKKIYISGKITGLKPEHALKNFEDAEFELKQQGYEVVNPMTIEHNHDGSWVSYMKVDLMALLSCDCVYMLNNWHRSRGAKIERNLAKDLEMQIIYQQ